MVADFTLYQAACKADQAWSAELTRVYGRNAGDARYDRRGCASEELAHLSSESAAAKDAWLAECKRIRESAVTGPGRTGSL